MPIFEIENQQCTFIHIPKTGGTSVEVWLESLGRMTYHSTAIPSFLNCSPQHLTSDNLETLGLVLNKPFCIIRDPYTRAESEYKFRMKDRQSDRKPEFSTWLLAHLQQYKKNKHHLDNHFLPQAYFVNSTVKRYKFEDGLLSICNEISQYLGLEPPEKISHMHQSEHLEVNWSNELIDCFDTIYGCDFELFGYNKKTMS